MRKSKSLKCHSQVMPHVILRVTTALLIAALVAGCSIYRMDIAQGNVVTQEMVNQLKTGMTRSQVRFVLGTPLVTDPFHPDRWEYYYSLRNGKENSTDTQRITVL